MVDETHKLLDSPSTTHNSATSTTTGGFSSSTLPATSSQLLALYNHSMEGQPQAAGETHHNQTSPTTTNYLESMDTLSLLQLLQQKTNA